MEAVLIGLLFLGEPLTAKTLLGLMLVTCGLLLTVFGARGRSALNPPVHPDLAAAGD